MILGLTGGIASGKSTVSSKLKDLGAIIIDADEISREVAKYKEVIEEIKKKIGKQVIKIVEVEKITKEAIDRVKLKEEIFKDSSKRAVLNNIMHPVIVGEIEKQIDEAKSLGSSKLIILDIPLLYETNLEYLCEKVLVVWITKAEQLKRLEVRDGISKELGEKIISSQMDLQEKLRRADYDIENSGSLGELELKVKKIYSKIV